MFATVRFRLVISCLLATALASPILGDDDQASFTSLACTILPDGSGKMTMTLSCNEKSLLGLLWPKDVGALMNAEFNPTLDHQNSPWFLAAAKPERFVKDGKIYLRFSEYFSDINLYFQSEKKNAQPVFAKNDNGFVLDLGSMRASDLSDVTHSLQLTVHLPGTVNRAEGIKVEGRTASAQFSPEKPPPQLPVQIRCGPNQMPKAELEAFAKEVRAAKTWWEHYKSKQKVRDG